MYKKSITGWIKHLDFIIIDLIALELSFLLAFTVRHDMSFWHTLRGLFDPNIVAFDMTPNTVTLSNFYRNVALGLGLASIIADVLFGNLRDVLKRGYLREIWAVLRMIAIVDLELIVILYVIHSSQQMPRLLVGYFTIFGVVFLYVLRTAYKAVLRAYLKNRKYQKRRMLIYTTRADAEEVLSELTLDDISEVEIAGIIGDDKALRTGRVISDRKNQIHIPIVAEGDEITSYLIKNWVDEIFFAAPRHTNTKRTNRREMENYQDCVDDLVTSCQVMGITTHREIEMTGHNGQQIVETVLGRTVLTESLTITSPAGYIAKRALDIIGALIGLAITGILMVFVAIPGILKNDPGPVFFKQKRIGKNGRIFNLYKFRSMYMDAEKRKAELMDKNEMQGNMFKMDADPRIIGSGPDGTRHGYGWFIRKTSIDEFPQFFNVLKGEMSLVGTRPPTLDEWDNYEAHHRARMAIRPGITGLWQVSGRNDITDFEDVINLDLEYINNWSLGGDIRILLATVRAVLKSKGAK